MTIKEKIDQAIKLDVELKEKKKELDGIKAELQGVALEDMENKNIKWKQLFGDLGTCDVSYKEKFDIDNYALLKEVVGSVLEGKAVRKEKVEYEIDNTFKKALITLYKGNYDNHDIRLILTGLGLDEKKQKAAVKKLKGDYLKDLEYLKSLGISGTLEEELDAIKEAKNYELINRYFNLEQIDLEKLQKAVWVEETISIGLNYQDCG